MIPFYPIDELTRLARIYVEATGMAPNTISIQACGESNNRVVGRLLKGRKCHVRAIEELSRFFVDHWPSNVLWPEDILHPDDVQNGHLRTGEADIVGAKFHKTAS